MILQVEAGWEHGTAERWTQLVFRRLIATPLLLGPEFEDLAFLYDGLWSWWLDWKLVEVHEYLF